MALVSLNAMSIASRPLFAWQTTFVDELEGLYEPWSGAPVPAPRLLALDEDARRGARRRPRRAPRPDRVAVFAGSEIPEGATPVAQAYAGHQFGSFSPRLGDGRALCSAR